MLQKMYNHEFTESQHKVNKENDGMLQEDLKFMQILDNGTRLVDGHYENHSHYVMIMSDSQITDYKLRRGFHICKEKVKKPSIQEWLYEVYEGTDIKRICNRISSSC